jgi:hypothetical protein
VYQEKKSLPNLFSNIAMETAAKSSYYEIKSGFFLKIDNTEELWMCQNKDNIKYH